jgi:hypothetical protein
VRVGGQVAGEFITGAKQHGILVIEAHGSVPSAEECDGAMTLAGEDDGTMTLLWRFDGMRGG